MMKLNFELLAFSTLLFFGSCVAQAQESLDPLNASPNRTVNVLKNGGINQVFVYQNASQDLPLFDDFSIDRTRKLNAQAGDANVTLTNTYYYLDSAGFSFDYMQYSSMPSIRTTYDTVAFADSTVILIDTLPSFSVTVADLSINPPTTSSEDLWMPWDLIDSVVVGGVITDTIFRLPDFIQDSLFVYSVAVNPATCECDGTTKPLILWQDDDALINGTYPVDPPTLGVATLEGLNRNGYPYNFNSTAFGRADKLTSVPINMQSSSADSVYLSFFYQPQGNSGDNVIQTQDSLYLEFYDVPNDVWEQRWAVGYSALQPFEQVMIPIVEFEYLMNGFQFRFVNEGSLAGALDHWHIDYVRLGRQRSFDDTLLVDVAYVEPESSLLETYTAVPFDHFAAVPGAFMADTVFLDQKNLDVNDRFITYGMRVGVDGAPLASYTDFPMNGNNISSNASSTFPSTHGINSAPNSYVYPVVSSDSCAFFRTQFYTNATPDINRCNDTVTFVQELSNYYAYDDGSAEAGYNLNVSGAKLAYRFDMSQPDTLRAVRMYFDPIFEDPSAGSFLVTIWSDINPETIIHQNITFSSPQYTQDGLNRFVEYELDSLVPVPNQYYIGFVQTSATKMNLGFDVNRNNNDRIFFNVSTVFSQTVFEGSLMMRPVLKSNKDPFLGVNEIQDIPLQALVYPNPSAGTFNVSVENGEKTSAMVLDSQGRLIIEQQINSGNGLINLDDNPNGIYQLLLRTESGRRVSKRLLLTR